MTEKNAAEQGRDALARWKDAQPKNWFDADPDLTRALQRLMGADRFAAAGPHLSEHGRVLASKVDPLVVQMERQWNLPRLDAWDGIGRQTSQVAYDGRHDRVGQYLYGSGVVAMLGQPGNVLHSVSLGYLANQLGEAGHNCPIVCTAGVVRALSAAASDEIKQRYLPGLLQSDYFDKLDGAQFMTEV
ncbi:MAG: acyl-CoA dehydrogenase, partial [Myxococcota bacterium]